MTTRRKRLPVVPPLCNGSCRTGDCTCQTAARAAWDRILAHHPDAEAPGEEHLVADAAKPHQMDFIVTDAVRAILASIGGVK